MKIIVALLLCTLVYVHASLSPEQMGKIQQLLDECKKKTDVSDDDFQNLMQHKLPETKNGKCFISCMKKSFGIMNDDNTINIEHIKELLTEHVKDAEKHEPILKIVETCAAEVSGGNDECEVAAKLMECGIKEAKAAEFNISIMELFS